MFTLHAKPFPGLSLSPAAACQQQQGEQQQQQQQQQLQHDPIAAAAGFLGLKVLGGEAYGAAAAAEEEAAAAEPAAAAARIEVEGLPPPYSSKWERHLAYSYGLYDPRRLHRPLNAKEIQRDATLFKQALDAVDPKDACKYLQLEEFKCLREHQAHRVNPKPCNDATFKAP